MDKDIAPSPKTYRFKAFARCNMCHAPSDTAKVLGVRLNQRQGRSPRTKTGIGVTICKCASCGMNYPQPLPIPEKISDHYGLPPQSYWQNKDFTVKDTYFAKQIAEAKRLLDFNPGMTALDIGAGWGEGMTALDRAGFDCQGIEPSEPFRNKAIELGIDENKLQLAAVEDAKFPEQAFDFINFGAVLEHLYDPAESIERTLEWLKPGGVIHIEVPSSDHLLPTFINAWFRLRGTNYVSNLSPMHSPFHLYAFTQRSFAEHGERAKYELAESRVEVHSVRHAPGFMKPSLRFWMNRFNRGNQLIVWLRKPK